MKVYRKNNWSNERIEQVSVSEAVSESLLDPDGHGDVGRLENMKKQINALTERFGELTEILVTTNVVDMGFVEEILNSEFEVSDD